MLVERHGVAKYADHVVVPREGQGAREHPPSRVNRIEDADERDSYGAGEIKFVLRAVSEEFNMDC